MLLSVLPDFDQRIPHVAPVRKPSRIVWQQRYEGIALVAYQGGKAVACVSGPWSGKYVLTWWEPMPGGQLEIFDTVDQACEAVERRINVLACGRPAEVHAVDMSHPAEEPSASWFEMLLRAFLPSRRRKHAVDVGSLQQLRQRYFAQETDLSGLNFSASR